jgi:ferredoxin
VADELEVIVDTELCIGSGQCVRTVPQVFDQRPHDGVVEPLDTRPPAEFHDAVRHAVELCPVGAILVVGADYREAPDIQGGANAT